MNSTAKKSKPIKSQETKIILTREDILAQVKDLIDVLKTKSNKAVYCNNYPESYTDCEYGDYPDHTHYSDN